MYFKWSDGNTKVQKFAHAISFGIPAFESRDGFKTCPKAGACAAICYARQGRYSTPMVQDAREHNLAEIRKDVGDFARKAVEDLSHMPSVNIVRVHDSGDMFSQEYLDGCFAVARAFPDIRFYAYTKSLHLNLWGKRPHNFQIIQSEGGLLDRLINVRRAHARIFATDYARRQAGYGDWHKTDTLALEGARKIGLIYHGVRRLTEAQDKYFR